MSQNYSPYYWPRSDLRVNTYRDQRINFITVHLPTMRLQSIQCRALIIGNNTPQIIYYYKQTTNIKKIYKSFEIPLNNIQYKPLYKPLIFFLFFSTDHAPPAYPVPCCRHSSRWLSRSSSSARRPPLDAHWDGGAADEGPTCIWERQYICQSHFMSADQEISEDHVSTQGGGRDYCRPIETVEKKCWRNHRQWQ